MSEVFNIKRFWNYFVTDTRNAWNNYGISLLLVAFMPLISFVLVELTSLVANGSLTDFAMPFKVTLAWTCVIVVILSFPVKHYGHITDKRFGSDFVLLPVSVFEKTLSLILVSCVVLPLFFVLVSGSVDLILSTIPAYGDSLISGVFQLFDRTAQEFFYSGIEVSRIAAVLQILAMWTSSILFFILGAIVFKRGKLAKTILVAMALSFVVMLLMIATINAFDMPSVLEKLFAVDDLRAFNVILNICNFVGIAVPMVLIYFRLRTIKH